MFLLLKIPAKPVDKIVWMLVAALRGRKRKNRTASFMTCIQERHTRVVTVIVSLRRMSAALFLGWQQLTSLQRGFLITANLCQPSVRGYYAHCNEVNRMECQVSCNASASRSATRDQQNLYMKKITCCHDNLQVMGAVFYLHFVFT